MAANRRPRQVCASQPEGRVEGEEVGVGVHSTLLGVASPGRSHHTQHPIPCVNNEGVTFDFGLTLFLVMRYIIKMLFG